MAGAAASQAKRGEGGGMVLECPASVGWSSSGPVPKAGPQANCSAVGLIRPPVELSTKNIRGKKKRTGGLGELQPSWGVQMGAGQLPRGPGPRSQPLKGQWGQPDWEGIWASRWKGKFAFGLGSTAYLEGPPTPFAQDNQRRLQQLCHKFDLPPWRFALYTGLKERLDCHMHAQPGIC